jgi:cytidyltransferase-like protein
MKKVFTVGVFDMFHLGHFKVLQAASRLGEYLIVGVHNDFSKCKGVEYFYSLEERMEIVNNLKFVNEVVSYERIDIIIPQLNFNILAHGPDQNHEFFQNAFNYCNKHSIEIIEVPRTDGISSTILRGYLKDKNI